MNLYLLQWSAIVFATLRLTLACFDSDGNPTYKCFEMARSLLTCSERLDGSQCNIRCPDQFCISSCHLHDQSSECAADPTAKTIPQATSYGWTGKRSDVRAGPCTKCTDVTAVKCSGNERPQWCGQCFRGEDCLSGPYVGGSGCKKARTGPFCAYERFSSELLHFYTENEGSVDKIPTLYFGKDNLLKLAFKLESWNYEPLDFDNQRVFGQFCGLNTKTEGAYKSYFKENNKVYEWTVKPKEYTEQCYANIYIKATGRAPQKFLWQMTMDFKYYELFIQFNPRPILQLQLLPLELTAAYKEGQHSHEQTPLYLEFLWSCTSLNETTVGVAFCEEVGRGSAGERMMEPHIGLKFEGGTIPVGQYLFTVELQDKRTHLNRTPTSAQTRVIVEHEIEDRLATLSLTGRKFLGGVPHTQNIIVEAKCSNCQDWVVYQYDWTFVDAATRQILVTANQTEERALSGEDLKKIVVKPFMFKENLEVEVEVKIVPLSSEQ